jgi:hypothetical protein
MHSLLSLGLRKLSGYLCFRRSKIPVSSELGLTGNEDSRVMDFTLKTITDFDFGNDHNNILYLFAYIQIHNS